MARRDRQFNLRLNDDEAARLDRLADHHGVNVATLLRMLLKQEERTVGFASTTAATTTATTKAKAKTATKGRK